MYWTTLFGGAFAPGTYEHCNQFQVSGNGRGCSLYCGRLVVHEIVIQNETVMTLSLDFEQHCDGVGTGGLFGAVRYRTGDLTCVAAEDGAACDDADACTASSTCLAGVCVTNGARPTCPSGDPCSLASVCHPTDASCEPFPPAPDGTQCDDASACTTDDRCIEGACGGSAIACDDASTCTIDACDPGVGCTFSPVAEQCWELGARAILRVRTAGTIQGHQVRCSGKCTTTGTQQLLIDGAAYRLPSSPIRCTNGEDLDPADEVGMLVASRRNRLKFAPDKLDELRNDLFFCTGARLKGLNRWMTLAPGGTESTGRETAVTKLPGRLPTRATIVTKYAGVLDGPAPEPPPLDRPLPDCSNLQVKCRVD
jgi:hypothetical protein